MLGPSFFHLVRTSEQLVLFVLDHRTTSASQQCIDLFYDNLQQTLCELDMKDLLIIMGDFNVKVGRSWMTAGGALGKFGVGDTSEAGERLIHFANANNLVVSNTCFKQVRRNRLWTW